MYDFSPVLDLLIQYVSAMHHQFANNSVFYNHMGAETPESQIKSHYTFDHPQSYWKTTVSEWKK